MLYYCLRGTTCDPDDDDDGDDGEAGGAASNNRSRSRSRRAREADNLKLFRSTTSRCHLLLVVVVVCWRSLALVPASFVPQMASSFFDPLQDSEEDVVVRIREAAGTCLFIERARLSERVRDAHSRDCIAPPRCPGVVVLQTKESKPMSFTDDEERLANRPARVRT